MIPRRIAILISGRGSNMVSLIAAARKVDFPGKIVLVASNCPDAAGLSRAEEAGIPTGIVDHRAFSDRETFERSLDTLLVQHDVDLVCLAGFMRVLTPWFVSRWAGKLINIHPSLLPSFRGRDTHERALEAGVLLHGCTVHFVVPEIDAGPIIAQSAVPVAPDDTPDSLAARVLRQEHLLYPQAVKMLCSGQARLEQGRVVFSQTWDATQILAVPAF